MPYTFQGPFAANSPPAYDTPDFLNGVEDGIDARSRAATAVVASSTASDRSKLAADYLCDGTADQVEINAALAAVGAGGKVLLTEGRFFTTAPIVIENHAVTLEGANTAARVGATHEAGMGTRIEAQSGVTDQVLLVQHTADEEPLHGVRLANFTVDGRSLSGPVDGIVFRSYMSRIFNVSVKECTGNGFKMRGYRTADGAPANWDLYDSVIAFVHVEKCDLAGIRFDGGATDMHLLHSIIEESGQDNLHFINGSSSIQVTGVHVFSAGRYGIHFQGTGSRSKFANCKIETSAQHGLFFDTSGGSGPSDVQFTGCGFFDNGKATTNTYDHVSHTGSSQTARLLLSGCTFGWKNSASTPNKPRYGVNAASSGATNWMVTGCMFGPSSNWGTGPINKASSASLHIDSVWDGSPETVIPASIGSMYRRRDGGATSTLYVKEAGTLATGWVGK